MARSPAVARAVLVSSVLVTTGLLVGGCPLGGSGGIGTGGGGQGGDGFNLPPSPIISTDLQRGIVPLTVQFTSEASSDDGIIVSREWDFDDGSTSSEVSPRHTFTSTGDFTVSLTLTDDQGASSTRTVVISATEAPVARIAVDRMSAESPPAIFMFDATASFDPDGEIEQVSWDFGDGSREVGALRNFGIIAHTFASPGDFRVRLTVTDTTGVTDSAETIISVGIARPSIQFRNPPGNVQNIVASQSSQLWTNVVFSAEPGVPRFVRAGLDGDADPCDAQSVIYNLESGIALQTLTGHNDAVRVAAFSQDGARIVTAGDDNRILLFDANTGGLIAETATAARVTSLAFSPDGSAYVYGQTNGDVVIRDFVTGTIIRQFTGHTGAVNDVAFSPNSDRILSASNDRTARLWRVADGTVLRTLNHDLAVNGVAFNPVNPDMIASAGEDNTVRLWDTISGVAMNVLEDHTAPVNVVIFSDDANRLVSGSDDNTARIYDLEQDPPVQITSFTGHVGDVLSLAFSADGSEVISGGSDATVRRWDAETGEQNLRLKPCNSPISSLSLAPSGDTLVASIASRNDIQLDTDPPQGNDLNLTVPQPLDVSQIDVGAYRLWAEIDTDRTEPVRVYANATINIVEDFTTELNDDTPVIPLLNDTATVQTNLNENRQVFDIGPIEEGDRISVSLLESPGYGEVFATPRDFGITLIDSAENVFAPIIKRGDAFGSTFDERVLTAFDDKTTFTAASTTGNFFVVVDGGFGANVTVERAVGYQARPQTVFVDFSGNASLGVGGLPAQTIPDLDASDFNQFFGINPNWGATQTQEIRNAMMARLNTAFSGLDITLLRSDQDDRPEPPFITLAVGGAPAAEPPLSDLLGVADVVDPRNNTLGGTGIVFATEIAQQGIGGDFENAVNNTNDLGNALALVGAHVIGKLLGLQVTDDTSDIMEGTGQFGIGDPTRARTFRVAPLSQSIQVDFMPAIGQQDAPVYLLNVLGEP